MVDVDAEMAEADGVIYAAAFQGQVAAIRRDNGQLIWNRDISSQTGIVLDGTHLYLTDEAGDVWALSRRNGATLWKQSVLHRRSLSKPAQQGRYLVLGDYDGYMHWLNKEDGSLAARTRVRNWQEHFPVKEEKASQIHYVEERSLLVPPLVEGTRVYGFDLRGVIDAYDVSIAERSE
jgi:outer membrane protein assembly factor BamB